jgi:hypothetical protein
MADGGARAFEALPPALWHALFALLPVDQRLRCREVCRAWCAALEERSLWTRLDLSAGSGVAAAQLANTTGLLAAAALRAGGQLQSLDVTGCVHLDVAALHGVVCGSAGTLREIRVAKVFNAQTLTGLLRAAPQLQLLHAAELSIDHRIDDPGRDEQVFAPLRLGRLDVACRQDAHTLLALALRLVAAAAPSELHLTGADLSSAAAIGAVVDAALAHRLSVVSLVECHLSAAAPPALARLVDGGAVTALCLVGRRGPFDELWDEEEGAPSLSLQRAARKHLAHVAAALRPGLLALPGRGRCAAGRADGPREPAHA